MNKNKILSTILLCTAFFCSGCGGGTQADSNAKNIKISSGVSIEMVPISDNILFGKYEVSQAQWKAVMGSNPSRFKGSNKPVENVSWNDCQEFLKKLNSISSVQESGLKFRLPMESEWEEACRAGAKGDYCKLKDETEVTEGSLERVAWHKNNSGKTTHAIGQKEPNALGLYDMHGNVWEWCQDKGSNTRWSANNRICRGGSWDDPAEDCGLSHPEMFPADMSSAAKSFEDSVSIGLRLCAVRSEITDIIASMTTIPGAGPRADEKSCGKDFMMGKTEVTQAQWEAVMGDNPARTSIQGVPEKPVEQVSRDDCDAFLEALNSHCLVKQSGLWFRLPTVDEWNHACQAGSTGQYCKLDDGTEVRKSTLDQVAWIDEDQDFGSTHPVGRKKPNAFGLYDMLGNVEEWTDTQQNGRYAICGGNIISSAETFSGTNHWRRLKSFCRNEFVGVRLCAVKISAKDREEQLEWQRKHPHPRDNPVSTIIADMKSIPGKNYLMCRTEVTQRQWEAVMCDNPSLEKESLVSDDYPVNRVSWYDCHEFMRRLNRQPEVRRSGLTFRLPTEEEWEYACRAGATGDFCRLADGTEITDSTLGEVAWFEDNSDKKTHPVGQKQPNAFGLYDMHGNVMEWTSTEVGVQRVFRGGCWGVPDLGCGSSFRYKESSLFRLDILGFRLCADSRTN